MPQIHTSTSPILEPKTQRASPPFSSQGLLLRPKLTNDQRLQSHPTAGYWHQQSDGHKTSRALPDIQSGLGSWPPYILPSIGTVIGLLLATFSFPTLVSPLSRVPLDHQCLPTLTHCKQDPRQTSLKLAAIARQDAHEGGGQSCSLAGGAHLRPLNTSRHGQLHRCPCSALVSLSLKKPPEDHSWPFLQDREIPLHDRALLHERVASHTPLPTTSFCFREGIGTPWIACFLGKCQDYRGDNGSDRWRWG